MSEVYTSRKSVTLINASLVGVAIAAWLSHQYPAYSLSLLALVILCGVGVSAAVMLSTRRISTAVETKSLDSTELVPLTKYYDALLADNYRATKLAIERLYEPSAAFNALVFDRNLLIACKGAWNWHNQAPFLDLTPPTDNYTVQVGPVTIIVRDGNTDVKIRSTPIASGDQPRRKIEAIFAGATEPTVIH